MNKIEAIQFCGQYPFLFTQNYGYCLLFSTFVSSAVLHGPTSGTKVTFAALLASVSYNVSFAFTPGLCTIQVNGGSYSIKKNVFLIDVIDNIDFGVRIHVWGINIQAVFTSTPVVFTSNAPPSIVCA